MLCLLDNKPAELVSCHLGYVVHVILAVGNLKDRWVFIRFQASNVVDE